MQRMDQSDLFTRRRPTSSSQVVVDIVERHAKGQPVLVGTTSVEKSERDPACAKAQGVPHEVLNAKQHEREARVVAMAGRKGAVNGQHEHVAGRGNRHHARW